VIPAQSKDPRGEKGFDPWLMTLLLLYAYCTGVVSSRRIERACYEDLAFRALTGNHLFLRKQVSIEYPIWLCYIA
jgi:transposase